MGDRLTDSFAAGSISGVITRVVSSPLDVLKVRLQLQVEPTSRQVSLSLLWAVVRKGVRCKEHDLLHSIS